MLSPIIFLEIHSFLVASMDLISFSEFFNFNCLLKVQMTLGLDSLELKLCYLSFYDIFTVKIYQSRIELQL